MLILLRLFGLLSHILEQLDNILIPQLMSQPTPLGHMPNTLAPDISILEILNEVFMDLITNRIDSTTITFSGQYNGVTEVRVHAFLFGVDTSQV